MGTWKQIAARAAGLVVSLGIVAIAAGYRDTAGSHSIPTGVPDSASAPRPVPGDQVAPSESSPERIARVGVQVDLPARHVSARSSHADPFGGRTRPLDGTELSMKWRDLAAQIEAERDGLDRCRAAGECAPAAKLFLAIIAAASERQGRARLGEVNRAINLAIRPLSDLRQYGVIDRWMPPLATLSAGAGDCEDYAIAKYVALREAGVPTEDLRLVIVRDTKFAEDHAVLASRLNGSWLVLDNHRFALVEDIELDRYVPIFSLDDRGVRIFYDRRDAGEARAPSPEAGIGSP